MLVHPEVVHQSDDAHFIQDSQGNPLIVWFGDHMELTQEGGEYSLLYRGRPLSIDNGVVRMVIPHMGTHNGKGKRIIESDPFSYVQFVVNGHIVAWNELTPLVAWLAVRSKGNRRLFPKPERSSYQHALHLAMSEALRTGNVTALREVTLMHTNMIPGADQLARLPDWFLFRSAQYEVYGVW